MIDDIDKLTGANLNADLCIIGAGAAGLTLASELRDSGLSILLLEAGRLRWDAATQALYDSEVVGLPHGGVHGLRFRVFGGSTTRWAGQALPLSPIDFGERAWIPRSGWPLTRSDLGSFYARASDALSVPCFPEQGQETWPSELAPPLPFGDSVRSVYSVFSPRPNFAVEHEPWLRESTSVRVVLGANVTQLVSAAGGTRVTGATVRSLAGHETTAAADRFVLCLGGIETPRLLLTSRAGHGGTLGNEHGLVGRFFQDHPGFRVGPIHEPSELLRRTFTPHRVDGVKFQPRLMMGEAEQERAQLVHCGADVLFDASEHPSIRAGKSLVRGIARRAPRATLREPARAVFRHPIPLAKAAWRFYVRRESAQDTGGGMVLTVGGEQVPHRDSRVLLSDRIRDAVGMPSAVLDWRMDPLDLRSYGRMAEQVAGELERLDLGRVDLDAFNLSEDPATESVRVVDAGHHMGTVRMSLEPSQGVVDADCRAHSVENLYIAGSSVFPTGGSSNPTYTILALTLRLADKLRA